jgi:hypothetical protein
LSIFWQFSVILESWKTDFQDAKHLTRQITTRVSVDSWPSAATFNRSVEIESVRLQVSSKNLKSNFGTFGRLGRENKQMQIPENGGFVSQK